MVNEIEKARKNTSRLRRQYTQKNRPTVNDAVAITFKQLIKATDALRTGSYAKTLTFTLGTTAP